MNNFFIHFPQNNARFVKYEENIFAIICSEKESSSTPHAIATMCFSAHLVNELSAAFYARPWNEDAS